MNNATSDDKGNLVVGLIGSIYIIFVMLPSLSINGLIFITFIKFKELHTPSNLLAVHISVIGLLTILMYSSVALPTFALSMLDCNCSLSYYKWNLAHVFHFSLYPLAVLSLSTSYFFVIKFSASVLTFKRVAISIATIWTISIIANVPALAVVPYEQFVNCCEEVCYNLSYICNEEFNLSFAPNRLSIQSTVYFYIRDAFLVVIPTILVFITSFASLVLFYRYIHKPPPDLERRMLFLPIFLSLTCGIFFIAQNNFNWKFFPPSVDDGIPGITFYVSGNMSWDWALLAFGALIYYFNVKLRKKSLLLFKCKKMKIKNEKVSKSTSSIV